MNSMVGFLLKVLIASAGIAIVIKDIAPRLAISATPANALIAVLSPTVILAIALSWRAWQYQQKPH